MQGEGADEEGCAGDNDDPLLLQLPLLDQVERVSTLKVFHSEVMALCTVLSHAFPLRARLSTACFLSTRMTLLLPILCAIFLVLRRSMAPFPSNCVQAVH